MEFLAKQPVVSDVKKHVRMIVLIPGAIKDRGAAGPLCTARAAADAMIAAVNAQWLFSPWNKAYRKSVDAPLEHISRYCNAANSCHRGPTSAKSQSARWCSGSWIDHRKMPALQRCQALVAVGNILIVMARGLAPTFSRPSLRGKVAVVTGGSRGIGKGIALELGAAGATVYVTGRSTRAAGMTTERAMAAGDVDLTIDATCEAIAAAGGRGVPVRCDAADDILSV